MSYTTTKNYGLLKPNVNSDNDVWGDHLNSDLDTLDTTIHGIDTRAAVTSFNTRTGAVTLQTSDVTTLGFATTTANDAAYINVSGDTMAGPLTLSGNAVSGLQAVPLQQLNAAVPAAGNVTPAMDSVGAPGVSTLYARQDHVHPTDTSRYAAANPSGYQTAAQVTTALAPYAPLASPALTGTPTAPTVSPASDSSTKVATTAFVQSVVTGLPAYAPLANPVFTGDPRAPTASPGDNDTSIATTAFVTNAVGGFAPLANPVFTGDPRAVTATYADNDTSIATTAFVQQAVAPDRNNVGRNLLHNALFNVQQRGAGPWTAANYTADRWVLNLALDTVSVSVVALVDASRTQIGDETARYALNNVFTGNAGAGATNLVSQPIEGARRLAGRTVTVSFFAVGSTAVLKLGVSLDQNMGTGGSPSASVPGNGQSVTLGTAWARYTLTFTLPSLAGKTLGTNGDDNVWLNFWYSSGANNAVKAGNIGVQSGTIQLWGVQLEIGTQATPLEKPDPQQDLAKCQRFYQTGNGQLYYGAYVAGAPLGTIIGLPVFMRAVPTLNVGINSNANGSGIAMNAQNTEALMLYGTAVAVGSVNVSVNFTASADL